MRFILRARLTLLVDRRNKIAHDLNEARPVGSKATFLSCFGPLIHGRQTLRSDTLQNYMTI